MYSSVISRPVARKYSSQASSNSSMVEYSAHGIISRRIWSLGACKLSASVTGISKPTNLRMALGSPTVLSVMRRAEIPMPHGAFNVRMASVTAEKLASGSPMPMNTTCEILSTPLRRPKRHACSTIRPRVRLPSSPPIPLAQNLQPTGQPTWLLTHAVLRSGFGIITHSVVRSVLGLFTIGSCDVARLDESGHANNNFCVPSLALISASTRPCSKIISCSNRSRFSLERLVICAGTITPFV